MQGKIIKGIAGFYYVYSKGATYECKAKGIFRKNKQKPLVGDDVKFDVLNEEDKIGSIEEILERHSELIRPAVANVDQALVVFAIKEPDPNLNLLDRFLIVMKQQNVPTVICFNKSDIASEEDFAEYKNIYEAAGYKVISTSAHCNEGIDEIKEVLSGKITTLAGPSGVGKSSIMNILNPSANMDTGEISRKIMRGKHTTRHSELIPISDDTYLMDTPGFSNIYLDDIEAEELKDFYSEFVKFEPYCKFAGCNHIGEKECGVRDAVADGELSEKRYDNYKLFFEEIKDRRKY
jgi:ribosome biogenesis GTPase